MESGFRDLALNALFPRYCLSCKKEGSLFCETCENGWVARPERAACPFCLASGSNTVCSLCRQETFLDGVSSYLPYGNPVVRNAISFWKYDGDTSIEPVLKKWLLQSRDRMCPPFESFVVAHIPVHASRRRSRGFDQSEHLAQWVSQIYQMPHSRLLERTQKTTSQAKTIHTDRFVGELDGIFSISPALDEIPECVVLCDDVFTSGATMDSAAQCLKEFGVKNVWGFVIAKGNS